MPPNSPNRRGGGPPCARFVPNVFSSSRCQNCYQQKTIHSTEALDKAKMVRKVTACGHLYVAPVGLDFSHPSHSHKRWQRRFFTLYDDGELSYALDDNPETVPQLTLDMNQCIRVCEADAITNHAHCILLAFKNDATSPTDASQPHPVVVYVKADTTEEIRRWQGVLQQYPKMNAVQMITPAAFRRSQTEDSPMLFSPPPPPEDDVAAASGMDEIAMEVSSQQESTSSRNSLNYANPLECNAGPELELPLSGTPRSIKQRDRMSREEPLLVSRRSSSPVVPVEAERVEPVPSSTAATTTGTAVNKTCQIDTSTVTLRKGWLGLRGKNDEWVKHWCVLAGLSLNLYTDIWSEDTNEPALSIDLTECENVYPSSSAKNYGIEIKCRKSRYILSAMTPGIRDSWIMALQQNLHNPSPTYPVESCASIDGHSQADSADLISLPRSMRKKHIAYVAPESHHSNSVMDEDSTSTEAEIDDEEVEQAQRERIAAANEASAVTPKTTSTARRSRPRRQHSVSPAMRRSPVNRVKDRGTHRRNGSSESSNLSAPCKDGTLLLPGHRRRDSSRVSNGSNYDSQERRLVSLETQVQTLRDQLHETKGLLTETQSENDRLRYMFANPDPEELAKLRQCLTAAEADVIQRQNEMDILRRQYDPPASGDYRRPLSSVYSADVSRRLVSLLKVQVGALSKVLHSSQSSKFTVLRPSVDKLIRTVANLDENAEQAIDKMENAFADVVAAYERLSSLIDYRRKDLIEAGTMTEAVETAAVASSSTETANGFVDEELIREIHDLEGELEDIQIVHSDEMEAQKMDFERQLRTLKERVEYEEASRRKLQEELQTLNSSNDQRIAAIKATYEDTIADLRQQFEIDLKKLRDEHQEELEDEKNATRLALDAVRRAHEEELVAATEKLRREHSTEMSNLSPSGAGGSDKNAKQMLDQMAAEIKSLSTMYTAKCLENSQLDEKMQALLADKENQTEREEMELHNRRMQRDIRQKDATIDELRLRISDLERRLNGGTSPDADQTDFNCSRRPTRRSLSRTPVAPKDYTFSYYTNTTNNNDTPTSSGTRTPRSRSNRLGTGASGNGTEGGSRVPVDRFRSVSTGRHGSYQRPLEGRSVPAS